MKNIDKILRTMTALYYVFVAVFVFMMVYTFINTGADSFKAGYESTMSGSYGLEDLSAGQRIAKIPITLFGGVFGVAVLVYFIKLLICFAKSIAKKEIFNLRISRLMTTFVIVMSALMVVMIIDDLYVAPDGTMTGNRAIELITEWVLDGTLFLLFAQMIKVGNYLQEEQKLTV